MPFKTILSVIGIYQVNDDLKLAIDLCRDNEAHLSVLPVALIPQPPISGYVAPAAAAWLEDRNTDIARLDDAVLKIGEILARNDISYSVEGIYTENAWASETLGERARYADLVLLGPSALADSDLKRAVANAGLFEAMRPLLLMPANSRPTLKPRKILLAWNSRLEASRAAREALELMVGAEAVHITLVDPAASEQKNGEEPGGDIALYLARHGVNVVVDQLSSGGRDVADVLKRHATDISADLIVMGAYGHSRFHERIFGGVTRTMLTDTTVPVLLAR